MNIIEYWKELSALIGIVLAYVGGIKSRGFKEYLECSALIGENINEIFEAIIKTIMQQPQKIQKPKPLLTSML